MDPEWKPVFESAVKECHKKVNAKLSDLLKKMEAIPFNVKKEECNVKYESMITCFMVETFTVTRLNVFFLIKSIAYFTYSS